MLPSLSPPSHRHHWVLRCMQQNTLQPEISYLTDGINTNPTASHATENISELFPSRSHHYLTFFPSSAIYSETSHLPNNKNSRIKFIEILKNASSSVATFRTVSLGLFSDSHIPFLNCSSGCDIKQLLVSQNVLLFLLVPLVLSHKRQIFQRFLIQLLFCVIQGSFIINHFDSQRLLSFCICSCSASRSSLLLTA